jgi:hypothetical protein
MVLLLHGVGSDDLAQRVGTTTRRVGQCDRALTPPSVKPQPPSPSMSTEIAKDSVSTVTTATPTPRVHPAPAVAVHSTGTVLHISPSRMIPSSSSPVGARTSGQPVTVLPVFRPVAVPRFINNHIAAEVAVHARGVVRLAARAWTAGR